MIVKRKNLKVCWFLLNKQWVQCVRFLLPVSNFYCHRLYQFKFYLYNNLHYQNPSHMVYWGEDWSSNPFGTPFIIISSYQQILIFSFFADHLPVLLFNQFGVFLTKRKFTPSLGVTKKPLLWGHHKSQNNLTAALFLKQDDVKHTVYCNIEHVATLTLLRGWWWHCSNINSGRSLPCISMCSPAHPCRRPLLSDIWYVLLFNKVSNFPVPATSQ